MNASHEDIYQRIFVKIITEGRRQGFSIKNDPKKAKAPKTTCMLHFLNIFS